MRAVRPVGVDVRGMNEPGWLPGSGSMEGAK
jgi:hypothetical protein